MLLQMGITWSIIAAIETTAKDQTMYQENCEIVVSGVAQATRCVNIRTARVVPLREKLALQFSCDVRD
jgi:pantothenate kinase type III